MYFEVGQGHIAEEDTMSRNVVQESGLGGPWTPMEILLEGSWHHLKCLLKYPEPRSSPTEPELLAGKAGILIGSPDDS